MKKRCLSLLLAILMAFSLLPAMTARAAGDVEINESNFPDEIFRNYVKENIDTDGNGILSQEEISVSRSIDVSNKGISSLKGVEFFTSLIYLYCKGNQLSSLDVSKNSDLWNLDCSGNKLTSLDLSNNLFLGEINCSNNQLTSLIINGCFPDYLDCTGNKIAVLDVRDSGFDYIGYCLDGSSEAYSFSVTNDCCNYSYWDSYEEWDYEEDEETTVIVSADLYADVST